MVIFILEPYLNDSHNYWLSGLRTHLNAEVKTFTLPAKHWKWRIHAAAITFSEILKNESEPDHIMVSDMCSASLLKSLLPKSWQSYTLSAYFHENQITYPWNQRDQDVVKDRNNHYGFINYSSALVADKVFFNSHYHKNVFTDALTPFLEQFPDKKNMETIQLIKSKSEVSPIGIEQIGEKSSEKWSADEPTILWNHRWEYDKNPKDFFKVLIALHHKNHQFRLIVLGNHGRVYPDVFEKAKEELSAHIVHWGYAKSREEYLTLVRSAHLLPVTSIQDFFGVSALEAISAGVFPLLPKRLAFPEHLSDQIAFYSDYTELEEKLTEFLTYWEGYKKLLQEKSNDYALEIDQKYKWERISEDLKNCISSIKNY